MVAFTVPICSGMVISFDPEVPALSVFQVVTKPWAKAAVSLISKKVLVPSANWKVSTPVIVSVPSGEPGRVSRTVKVSVAES